MYNEQNSRPFLIKIIWSHLIFLKMVSNFDRVENIDEKERVLVTSIFYFSHNISKSH